MTGTGLQDAVRADAGEDVVEALEHSCIDKTEKDRPPAVIKSWSISLTVLLGVERKCMPGESEEPNSVTDSSRREIVVLIISGDEPCTDGAFYDCEEDNETEDDCTRSLTVHLGRKRTRDSLGWPRRT